MTNNMLTFLVVYYFKTVIVSFIVNPFQKVLTIPATRLKVDHTTLFESENGRQKIEPVPIPLLRASRNFPDVKTRNENFFHNWTWEIIPFIH